MSYTGKDFYNRELSWIEFNKRVLSEAEGVDNPLLEKLKFLAIVSSNFDEFFKVRVAGLKAQEESNLELRDIAGLLPKEQLSLMKKEVIKVIEKQYKLYPEIMSKIKIEGNINIKNYSELMGKELRFIENYYNETLFPILTPMAIDTFRPFPHLNSGAINLILNVKEKDGVSFAIVEIPRVVNRLIKLPGGNNFILLEEVIKNNLNKLFNGYEILDIGYFRITRDEDLGIEENSEAEDLLSEIEKEVKNRKWGNPVRVEYIKGVSKKSLEFLKEQIELEEESFYAVLGPLDLTFLWGIVDVEGVDNLKFPKNVPKYYKEFSGENIFKVLSKKNILLRHPFESFEHVTEMVKVSSQDPKVLAIKQTLYRVSGDSPIIKYLKKAAENGKQVTVLVELKARFDEERNVKWARELEEAGCHVIYGLSGLKTHAKCLLIIRKEDDGIKRYIHLGTGNYNDSTAKLYVDYSFFTKDEEMGIDASYLFNKLTGFSKIDDWKKLIVAPTHLRYNLYKFIDREIENVSKGGIGKIIIKVNGLTDQGIIEKLYDASKAGVEIVLIVRGACCLKSNIEGLSENIKVYSLVGRFLEHDRIYYFENNGDEELYLGSADCMTRNLDGRVETIFPLENKDDRKKVTQLLKDILKDNVKLRIQNKNGSYSLISNKSKKAELKFNYQEYYREKVNE
ncbi:polyphosphate kinase 1 [Candidatus Cetobacterium colombiensis]|uniref:Polyphosphate kinase n=1 Tax=Candidatus Cetobacterium colombiensis TaxID=3073100 RepID=A0ABU4WAE5_9FUSO|nr:polyphosphate kinase 1 [Candidatus Cetobacterium colombiensis]MDX8336507.1 polyphosphate kinase 1 [Candidatus Cetobacterium colombiensis]